MNKNLHLPSKLVIHVTSILGERGVAWLERLPSMVSTLEAEWSVEIERPFEAGEYNFVAPATRADGERVVLKIAPPFNDTEYIGEADFLRHRKGRGAVRLLERDHERRAILIERAVPGKNLAELFTGIEELALPPAIDVLRAITGEPPIGPGIKTLDDWFAGMKRAVGTRFPAGYVTKAFEIYDRLSSQPGRTFYLHGDFHPGNVVSAERMPYLAIDPKGIIGHIGYDIAVFLNNFHWWQETRTDLDERLDHALNKFSLGFEINAGELREWAFAQMVLGAWWSFDDMPQHYDDATVAKADIWKV